MGRAKRRPGSLGLAAAVSAAFAVALVVGLAAQSLAFADDSAPRRPRARRTRSGLLALPPMDHVYSLSGVYAFQQLGSVMSGGVGWDPSFRFTDDLNAGFHFGAMLFKSAAGKSFVAAEYQLMLSLYAFSPLYAEVGGGAQSWFGNGGTRLIGGTNVGYLFPERVFGLVDRVFAGYAVMFTEPVMTSEVKLGVGITLGKRRE